MELTGRVTKDAIIKTLPDERQVVEFSIAVNDYVKPKAATEGKEITQYFRCSYWKGTGVALKLLKGAVVEVNGRVKAGAYVNKQGEAKASLHFHCNGIKVFGITHKKEGENKEVESADKATPQVIENIAAITEPMDDMPF